MRWTLLPGLALGGGFLALLIAGVTFSPGLLGVSGCPILARMQPVKVALADDTDFVEMDRQPDLGRFPSFRLRVRGDGRVDWEGRGCVAALGAREGQMDPQSAKTLIERFEAEGFCRLCRNYYPDAEHADTTRLTLSLGGERTDVVEQLRNPPGEFSELAREVERTPVIARWIGGSASWGCWVGK
jgi:hypothetical protein